MDLALEKIYEDIKKKICIYLYNFEYPLKKTLSEYTYSQMKERENTAIIQYMEDDLFHRKVDCLTNEILKIIETYNKSLNHYMDEKQMEYMEQKMDEQIEGGLHIQKELWEALEKLEEYAKCGLAHNGRDYKLAKEWAITLKDNITKRST